MSYFSSYFTNYFGDYFGLISTVVIPDTNVYVELSLHCDVGITVNIPVTLAGDEVYRMSNFGELKRQVLLNINQTGGRATLVVEQAINNSLKIIAGVQDFDELRILDVTNAFTIVDKKLYHITNDLALVRPKDIYTIRYMDGTNSRKLEYVPLRDLDKFIPYTEITATNRPLFYTRRGMYLEFYPIPNAAKPLYIQHSQWPAQLTFNADEPPYINIDHVIVALATDMSASIIEGSAGTDWFQRAQQLLGSAVREETERPDRVFVAKGFNSQNRQNANEYWTDPFNKGDER